MEDDLFYITINVAEVIDLKIRIKRDDEEQYRNAANYVKSKFQEYQKKHPKQGIETHLSLVSLELALEVLEDKKEKGSIYNRIGKLVKELEENFKE